MHPLIVECKTISKQFVSHRRSIDILRNVSFTVKKSEIVVVSGRSGQGKSVLLSLICGLDKPTSGTIRIDGENIINHSLNALAKIRQQKIGIVFQNYNLIPTWNALDNVLSAFPDLKMGRNEFREKAVSMLEQVGLEKRLQHLPHELSMGEQQRVAVARALIKDPQLIVADEPVGDVDEETGEEILNLLVKAVKEQGTSLLVATHGDFPLHVADRIFVLNQGMLSEKEKELSMYPEFGEEANSFIS